MASAALKSALRERLDVLQSLWMRRDAEGIVNELYTQTTEIAGPGSEPLLQGSDVLVGLVRSLVDDSRGAAIRIDRIHSLGGAAAYTWVTWSVLPRDGEAFSMKSLFVWVLTDSGWRIAADMYAEGEIPA
ncbi:protein of unknown function [Pseudomonas citronellolis]|uniref:DUF4440 domain-containing protein n=1 Tax=Pseudomonas citronellolis TaxID=53408 RepID=A0AAQ1KG85_9PSED|nr:DUF4440 domain-containing protein [Pseudomonas citronellolis]MCP1603116.1 hypothetical protein [Pseudomonas citronellolis]MCP1654174.1 hypothetical protein [Pseudomonas citronellolis]MCP1720929.1 hypothetical protein [Pseudomonas citronellolis]TGC21485.1 DUF4440 domain-containing protein [Pseudomonas citronellolis]UUC52680.1 DUF4440 domain-containing protein [Pseudomonas citronellolis]